MSRKSSDHREKEKVELKKLAGEHHHHPQQDQEHQKKLGPPKAPARHHPRAVQSIATAAGDEEDGAVCGRERLKRHRVDVAGRVWIPEIWGQEELLNDWIDCSALDRSLFPTGVSSAREALAEEGRRKNSGGLPIGNRC